MPIEWVHVRNDELGGETTIPAKSLSWYEARGWHSVDEVTAEQTTTASSPPTPAATTRQARPTREGAESA